jgi:hypothetical protein
MYCYRPYYQRTAAPLQLYASIDDHTRRWLYQPWSTGGAADTKARTADAVARQKTAGLPLEGHSTLPLLIEKSRASSRAGSRSCRKSASQHGANAETGALAAFGEKAPKQPSQLFRRHVGGVFAISQLRAGGTAATGLWGWPRATGHSWLNGQR